MEQARPMALPPGCCAAEDLPCWQQGDSNHVGARPEDQGVRGGCAQHPVHTVVCTPPTPHAAQWM
eukprot:8040308-Alexandrium_andersonii.AAC.1